MKWKTGAAILAIAAGTTHAHAQSRTTAPTTGDIVVTGKAATFASVQVSQSMIERRSARSSVNDVIKERPGVFVAEGDAFGSSDGATWR